MIFTNNKNSNVKEQHSINEYTESQTKESSQSLQDKRENNHEKEEYITQQTEGYCFHILTDFIQQNTYNKLQDLAKELSSEFEGCTPFHQSFVPYYFLLFARFVPDCAEMILGLGADMLAQGDIREYFSIDLGENIMAAALDVTEWRGTHNYIVQPKANYSHLPPLVLDIKVYCNNGGCLINLKKWKEQNIEKQCLDITKHYELPIAEQDAMHFVLRDKTLIIEPTWNMLVACLVKPDIQYPNKDKVKNPKILHYAGRCIKPWGCAEYHNSKLENTMITNKTEQYVYDFYQNIWWEIALQTPVFDKELEILRYITLREKHLIAKINEALYHHNNRINTLHRRLQRILNPHKFLLDLWKKYKK